MKATSKGIVLNVHDFKGPVEFLNNTVRHNNVFIPTAIIANSGKFNSSVLPILFNTFVQSTDNTLRFEMNETSILNNNC